MQQTFPFKMDGTNPRRLRLPVGDMSRAKMTVAYVSGSALTIDAQVCGWFGREVTKADADKIMGVQVGTVENEGDWEFQSGGLWFDVPPGTSFVTVHALAAGRGMVIVEDEDGPNQ